ncbi:hypothetical protein J6590_096995, partial [Homalodisca vitripennis]
MSLTDVILAGQARWARETQHTSRYISGNSHEREKLNCAYVQNDWELLPDSVQET